MIKTTPLHYDDDRKASALSGRTADSRDRLSAIDDRLASAKGQSASPSNHFLQFKKLKHSSGNMSSIQTISKTVCRVGPLFL